MVRLQIMESYLMINMIHSDSIFFSKGVLPIRSHYGTMEYICYQVGYHENHHII